MSRLIKLSIVAISLFIVCSCQKPDSTPKPDPIVKFTSNLTGAQEIPANISAATAYAFVTFNTDTKLFAVSTTYSNFTGVPVGNVHKGAVGIIGPVIFPFTSLGTPQVLTHLDATQETDLMANLYYINVSSSAYPGGEIRGQLIKQ